MLSSCFRIAAAFVCALALSNSTGFSQTVKDGIAAQRISPEESTDLQRLKDWIARSQSSLEAMPVYSCKLQLREELRGELNQGESYQIKVQNKPFKVYMHCEAPKSKAGKEIIYDSARSKSTLLASLPSNPLATLELSISGKIASMEHRRPVTSVGLAFLVHELQSRLQEASNAEGASREIVTVRMLEPARAATGQSAFSITVQEASRETESMEFVATFDQQLSLLVGMEAFQVVNGSRRLVESCKYDDIKSNTAGSPVDFSVDNPAYRFPQMILNGEGFEWTYATVGP